MKLSTDPKLIRAAAAAFVAVIVAFVVLTPEQATAVSALVAAIVALISPKTPEDK